MIVPSFEKCGISVAPDGSEDDEINIVGLEDYSVESDDDEDPDSDNGEDGEVGAYYIIVRGRVQGLYAI